MFAKSAFVVRSLFVAAVLGSLVACTFDPSSSGEDKGDTSSALAGKKGKVSSSADAAVDPIETSSDGGIETENDASCCHCGDEDGGPSDVDGGPYDGDGGVSGNDGGWWGDDDDDTSADGGVYDDRDAGF